VLVRPMIASWEVPHIERIASREARRLARFAVPGLAGDLHQDLGRSALCVEISGSLSGDELRNDVLKDLRTQFLAGAPVAFVADIVTESELEQVLIEELHFEEVNDSADAFRYRILLREYTEPPEPPAFPPDAGFGLELDELLDLDALSLLDGLDLPGLLADVPNLQDALSPVKEAATQLKDQLSQISTVMAPLQALLGGE
jgi:hypothetical protein